MRRPSLWLFLVVLLLGALLRREPVLQRFDDAFLHWFMLQSAPPAPPSHVTLVEITRQDFESLPMLPNEKNAVTKPGEKTAASRRISPLEYALFLQALLGFEPAVIGLEPIVVWRDRDKDQEQVFIDQAMRVPKLLVAVVLGDKGPLDISTDEILSFTQVAGERSALPEFPGVQRRPDDDIRLISTPGYINLPTSDSIQVPMLLQYRGEIVPSFPLQAVLLWLKCLPNDVKIELGAQIDLPNGWKIPIRPDGTVTINPAAAESVRRLTLNQLLLAAQEREGHRAPTIDLANLKDQIVLFRIADDPLQPPNIFAAAIATIQGNVYVRPAPAIYEWVMILALAILGGCLWMISKGNFLLGAIAVSAGYCLLLLGMLSEHRLWLPAFLPCLLFAFLLLVRLFGPRSKRKA
jgi:hypothetical protein